MEEDIFRKLTSGCRFDKARFENDFNLFLHKPKFQEDFQRDDGNL